MIEAERNLGGEQSGHIIFLDHNTTGDGILTAIQLLSVMKRTGKKASELGKSHGSNASGAGKCPRQ